MATSSTVTAGTPQPHVKMDFSLLDAGVVGLIGGYLDASDHRRLLPELPRTQLCEGQKLPGFWGNRRIVEALVNPRNTALQTRVFEKLLEKPNEAPTLLKTVAVRAVLRRIPSLNFPCEMLVPTTARGAAHVVMAEPFLADQRKGVAAILEAGSEKCQGAFEYLWKSHLVLLDHSETAAIDAVCQEEAFHRAMEAAKTINLQVQLTNDEKLRYGVIGESWRNPLRNLEVNQFERLAATLSRHASRLEGLKLGSVRAKFAPSILEMQTKMPNLEVLGLSNNKIFLRHPRILAKIKSLETYIDGMERNHDADVMMNDPLPLLGVIRDQAPCLRRLKLEVWDVKAMGDRNEILRAASGIQDLAIKAANVEQERHKWKSAIETIRPPSLYRTELVHVPSSEYDKHWHMSPAL